jgi:hypothetical protein
MAVEVLQRLQEKSEKTEQKQDQQMAEILSRKDEKIKIQRDLFNLQKKHMKMTMQQKKKKNSFREKESEAQLISAESGIMSVDIEKVPPHLKKLLSWHATANHGAQRVHQPLEQRRLRSVCVRYMFNFS